MTSQDTHPTFHTVSPLHVGARIAVVLAVCAALVAGFVGSLGRPGAESSSQVAGSPAACAKLPC